MKRFSAFLLWILLCFSLLPGIVTAEQKNSQDEQVPAGNPTLSYQFSNDRKSATISIKNAQSVNGYWSLDYPDGSGHVDVVGANRDKSSIEANLIMPGSVIVKFTGEVNGKAFEQAMTITTKPVSFIALTDENSLQLKGVVGYNQKRNGKWNVYMNDQKFYSFDETPGKPIDSLWPHLLFNYFHSVKKFRYEFVGTDNNSPLLILQDLAVEKDDSKQIEEHHQFQENGSLKVDLSLKDGQDLTGTWKVTIKDKVKTEVNKKGAVSIIFAKNELPSGQSPIYVEYFGIKNDDLSLSKVRVFTSKKDATIENNSPPENPPGTDGGKDQNNNPPGTDGEKDQNNNPPGTDGGKDQNNNPSGTDGEKDQNNNPPGSDGGKDQNNNPPGSDGGKDQNNNPPKDDQTSILKVESVPTTDGYDIKAHLEPNPGQQSKWDWVVQPINPNGEEVKGLLREGKQQSSVFQVHYKKEELSAGEWTFKVSYQGKVNGEEKKGSAENKLKVDSNNLKTVPINVSSTWNHDQLSLIGEIQAKLVLGTWKWTIKDGMTKEFRNGNQKSEWMIQKEALPKDTFAVVVEFSGQVDGQQSVGKTVFTVQIEQTQGSGQNDQDQQNDATKPPAGGPLPKTASANPIYLMIGIVLLLVGGIVYHRLNNHAKR
ncbi:LPXTG-motif cell wall anchor domain-containing protein [Seinonella peptonophila]|uniref:LPXTG-motif cell wall anchor domain-containing protein n=1 Tax=Seinonella peptonophila TaxID=112248 RepID=A0A1M4ZFW6_9BACL|nr:LPXTG cell wall anchor domain-containing protein [Seinonella peptonophila]SHF16939.1 LPXTG-motif cell wall anchor domain-containing protein [Seinonella peptonophila]